MQQPRPLARIARGGVVGEQAAPARRVGPSPADQAAEIARLRRELDRVRMERDILKRAALIFGQAADRR